MASGILDLGGLTAGELARRTWKEMMEDGVTDAAAQLAYYFMLALFPLLIFLISLLATVRATTVVESFVRLLESVMPGQAYDLVGSEVARIMAEPQGGLLTFGALATLWAASSGVASLMYTLDRAYDVVEERSFVRLRATAIVLTVALATLIITGGIMIMTGDKVSAWLAASTGMSWVASVGTLGNYALGLVFMFLGLELIYYFGPNVQEQKFAWISPGSLVGVILFVLASIGFSVYLRFGDSYTATYGSIGAVIILMLWLYILGAAVVVGGEINAEIAHAALARGRADAPEVTTESHAKAHEYEVSGGTSPAGAPAPAPPPGPVLGAEPGDGTAIAVMHMLEALRHENSQVRASTLVALRTAGPAAVAALPAVIRALEDPKVEVRREAVGTLEYLLEKHGEARAQALEALERAGAPRRVA